MVLIAQLDCTMDNLIKKWLWIKLEWMLAMDLVQKDACYGSRSYRCFIFVMLTEVLIPRWESSHQPVRALHIPAIWPMIKAVGAFWPSLSIFNKSVHIPRIKQVMSMLDYWYKGFPSYPEKVYFNSHCKQELIEKE